MIQKRVMDNKRNKGFPTNDAIYDLGLLFDEFRELEDAIRGNLSKGSVGYELADIVLLCYGLADMHGRDLEQDVLDKLRIIEKRKYRFVNGEFIREELI